MHDFAWTGKKGHYWISFDEEQDGRIRAQASGPLKTPGVAESIGPIAKKAADTKEEAEALLFEELKRLNAKKTVMAKKHGPAFVREGIANLHDVFLNASLLRNRMLASPVEYDPQNLFFHLVTDRFRLERLWMMELYVLVEAWRSKVMAPVRARLASAIDLSELESVLEQRTLDNTILGMRQVRDYMVHRDRKRYWDLGRTAQIGGLAQNESIHEAFRRMLSKAIDYAKENLPQPDPPVLTLVDRGR